MTFQAMLSCWRWFFFLWKSPIGVKFGIF